MQETIEKTINKSTKLKARKLKAETLIKEEVAQTEKLKRLKLEGSLVAISEISECFTAIGAKTKSQLARLVSELPPKLEGLSANAMVEIIRDSISEICAQLAEAFTLEVPLEDTPQKVDKRTREYKAAALEEEEI